MFSFNCLQKVYIKLKNNNEQIFIQSKEEIENNIYAKMEVIEPEQIKNTQELWQIEIPKIELIAPIAEDVTKEIMDQYVGHFPNTPICNGNVGLAAHNRGYNVNYFGRIKELKIGDEIIYKTIYGTKKYKVNVVTIISDTDWSYLENTKENKITLITCVENKPTLRRCIQGLEI